MVISTWSLTYMHSPGKSDHPDLPINIKLHTYLVLLELTCAEEV